MGSPKQKPASKKPRLFPYCNHCKKRFSTTSLSKKFCQNSCRYASSAAKKVTQRKERVGHAPFIHYVAAEAIKAGTVEILHGATVDSLIELYSVYVYAMKASGLGSSTANLYEISHIAPRKGAGCVGLLHAQNLVVAPKLMNRQHQNKHFGKGLSIRNAQLQPRWRVEENASGKDVIAKIFEFLGDDIVSGFQARAKLKPSVRHKLMLWFEAQKDCPSLEELNAMKTPALQKLKAKMEDKEVFRLPSCSFCPETVFLNELQRHSAYHAELAELIPIWQQVEAAYSPFSEAFVRDFLPVDVLTTCHRHIFDVLHGASTIGSAETLRTMLAGYID